MTDSVSQQWIDQQRSRAARWAYDLFQSGFLVLDCETTGLDDDDEIIQLGVVDQDGHILIDRLLKPFGPISPRASAVHGLTLAHLFGAPAFRDIYTELALLLPGQPLVAYNADFDARLLDQTCTVHGLPPIPDLHWEDAMRSYARYRGVWNLKQQSFQWVRLTDACAFEGIDSSGAHAAIGDCLLTLDLIRTMAHAIDPVEAG